MKVLDTHKEGVPLANVSEILWEVTLQSVTGAFKMAANSE
jgi:hypothetical protein